MSYDGKFVYFQDMFPYTMGGKCVNGIPSGVPTYSTFTNFTAWNNEKVRKHKNTLQK